MRHADVLIMLVQGSAHPEGLVTLAEAQQSGMKIIVLTGSPDSILPSGLM